MIRKPHSSPPDGGTNRERAIEVFENLRLFSPSGKEVYVQFIEAALNEAEQRGRQKAFKEAEEMAFAFCLSHAVKKQPLIDLVDSLKALSSGALADEASSQARQLPNGGKA